MLDQFQTIYGRIFDQFWANYAVNELVCSRTQTARYMVLNSLRMLSAYQIAPLRSALAYQITPWHVTIWPAGRSATHPPHGETARRRSLPMGLQQLAFPNGASRPVESVARGSL